MAANALDGHEIESITVNDEFCRFRPDAAWIIGGAKVLVNKADEDAALDVIGSVYTGDPPYVGSFIIVGIQALGFLAVLLIRWLSWRKRKSTPDI